jgi:hypothetical protein
VFQFGAENQRRKAENPSPHPSPPPPPSPARVSPQHTVGSPRSPQAREAPTLADSNTSDQSKRRNNSMCQGPERRPRPSGPAYFATLPGESGTLSPPGPGKTILCIFGTVGAVAGLLPRVFRPQLGELGGRVAPPSTGFARGFVAKREKRMTELGTMLSLNSQTHTTVSKRETKRR